MTLEEVYECAQSGTPVWYVGAFMFQYYAFQAQIVGVSFLCPDTIPEVTLEDVDRHHTEERDILHIYKDGKEAQKISAERQKECGHVVITQKEYDEILAWKDANK